MQIKTINHLAKISADLEPEASVEFDVAIQDEANFIGRSAHVVPVGVRVATTLEESQALHRLPVGAAVPT